MQTSVTEFPRIGTLRELKFASEKYFKKEIEAGDLLILNHIDPRLLLLFFYFAITYKILYNGNGFF